MIKTLIAVAAFSLTATSQISLAGTSQTGFSSTSANSIVLATKGNKTLSCKNGRRHASVSKGHKHVCTTGSRVTRDGVPTCGYYRDETRSFVNNNGKRVQRNFQVWEHTDCHRQNV